MSWLKELNCIFNRKQKLQFLGLFIIEFIGSLLELLGVSMLIPFMQVIIDPGKIMDNKWVKLTMDSLGLSDQRELVIAMVVLMIVVYALKNLYLIFMLYMQQQIMSKNRVEMELKVMNYYVRQPYIFHAQRNSSEVQRIILGDIGNVFAVLRDMFMILAEGMTGLMLLVFLFAADSLITTIVFALLLLFILLYFKVFKRRLYLYGEIAQHYGSEGIKYINQMLVGVKEIKVYRSENHFINAFATGRRRQISMMKRGAFFQQSPKYLMEMIVTCGILGLLLIKMITGTEPGELIIKLGVFAMAAYRILPSANRITSELANVFNLKSSVDVVYHAVVSDNINLEHDFKAEKAEAVKIREEHMLGTIKMENVTFGYPGSDKKVLDGVSMTIRGGTSVALKGPSGAGKTTTADLLLGILQPDSGRIAYENRDIRELEDDWYSHIAYIPQNIYLSDDSIRANVAFGADEPDDNQIWRALEEAQLKSYVESLPDGLDSMIGENGVRMSGGQRQRIGIARALYRNPEILILDEATSALDNETEKAVMSSIDYLKGKKTLIIIAHRLTTIENCDEVFEVNAGKIVKQEGTQD